MARARSGTSLNVFVNGRLAGCLRRERSGAVQFQYDESWLSWEHRFPISLALPLRESKYTGERVTAVLENLLPDDVQVRRQLAARVQSDGEDAYSLLNSIGRDCIGALQFLPEDSEPGSPGAVEGEAINDERVASLLADLGNAPLGVSSEDEEFRISVGGAQEKTALLFWKKRWHLPHGSTATTHILKPAIGTLRNGIDLSRSVENEHLCMRLTAAFGLPTANTSMQTFGSIRTLVVERFDRRWTRDKRLLRLPQEDLCQALSVPPSRKYQSDGGPGSAEILEFLKASDDPQADRRMFVKAQIVFWLLGATDGHAKNFSIFLFPGGGFRLTPLYDVMSLQPALAAHQIKRNRMKLAMSVGEKRHYVLDTIQPRHFVQSAEGAGIPVSDVETLFDEVAKAASPVTEILRDGESDIPAQIRRAILDGFKERLALIHSYGI